VITCPNCGRENPETVRLCSFCDHELQASKAINCPVCGRTNAPDNEVCPHCGTNLQEAVHSRAEASPAEEPTPAGPSAEEDADDIRDLFSDLATGDTPEATPSEQPLDWLVDGLTDQPGEEAAEPGRADAPVPEWLQEPAEPVQPETPTVSDDWLDAVLKADDQLEEEAGAAPAEDDAGTPDWLPEATTTPAAPAQPEAEPASDDWLDRALGADDQLEEEAAPPAATPAEGDAAVPDWLTDLEPTPAAPAQPEPQTVSDDWLDQALGADDQLEEEAAPPAATPAEGDAAVPDWLTDLEPTPAAPAQPEPQTVSDDWLDQALGADDQLEEEAAPPAATPAEGDAAADWLPTAQPSSPAAEGDPDAPDWLAQVGITSEAPAGTDADADVPDWLSQVVSDKPAPSPPAQETTAPDEVLFTDARPPAPEQDMPDWLAAVTREKTGPLSLPEGEDEPEPVEAMPPDAGVAARPADEGEEDMPDWLAAIRPTIPQTADLPPAPSPAPFEGSLADLLAEDQATLEEAMPAEPVEAVPAVEPVDLESGDLPDWLRAVRPAEDGTIEAEVGPSDATAASAELPEQMEMLRATSIPGVLDPEADVREENVGPLKGVMGVVAPAPIFIELQHPAEAAAEPPVQVDNAQVALLQDLLHPEAEGAPVAGALRSVQETAGRGLVTLLLLAAIGLPIVAGITPFDAPATIEIPAADAARSLSALDASSTVLLAFEYDPSQAGEVGAEAEALITTLMARDVTLYAVSTQPTGPAIAQDLLSGLAEEQGYVYGEDYLNLGYVSARATGVRGLVTGGAAETISPLAYDYKGASTGFAGARLADLDLDMIVLLAGTPESVRMWVEQAGNPTGIPMVAAVGAGTESMTLPYYHQGRQLEGVVSGLAGATSVTLTTQDVELSPALDTRMNAQVAGALAAGLALVIGIVVQIFAGRSRRP